MTKILFGNSNDIASHPSGWFVGHFIDPPDDPRSANAVEVKWYTHPAGDSKAIWTKAKEATTLAILIQGRFLYRFPGQEILLTQQGDYVLWGAGIFHSWHAEKDSVVLTIRWPSKPDDVIVADQMQSRQLEEDSSRLGK